MFPFNIKDFSDTLYGYLDARFDLLQLGVKESVAGVVVSLVRAVLLLVAALMLVLFLSLALAGYLNSVMNSSFGGYLIVAGVHGVLLMVALRLNKSTALKETVATAMFNDDKDNAKKPTPPQYDHEDVTVTETTHRNA